MGPVYVFNGFFMSMRSKFTAPGTEIYWYSVEWDSAALSWANFRGQVLGPTDPTEAPKDSLRGQILAKWKELGLESQPDVGDNGMHASASPFEAFAERNNWMGVAIKEKIALPHCHTPCTTLAPPPIMHTPSTTLNTSNTSTVK